MRTSLLHEVLGLNVQRALLDRKDFCWIQRNWPPSAYYFQELDRTQINVPSLPLPWSQVDHLKEPKIRDSIMYSGYYQDLANLCPFIGKDTLQLRSQIC